MVAVIIGGTGLVGSLLVEKLLSTAKITRIISVGRRSLGISDTKLDEVIIADLTHLEQFKNELLGDLYFCCSGTTIKDAGSKEKFREVDFDLITKFGEIAKINNAKVFAVISAAGANSQSIIFYNKIKGQTEEFLRKLALQRLIIFKPSLLIGKRKRFRLAENLAASVGALFAHILPQSLVRATMTNAEDLAQCMLESALRSPLDSKNTIQIIEARDIRSM